MRISDWSSDVCSSDLAAVHLARHLGAAVGNLHLRRKGALAPAEQRRKHLARLVRIIVDRLLAEDHHARLLFLGDLRQQRSEEHTSELQSLMRISYAVFCLKKKT